ncbi:nonsense-mediated mRNA decay factor SMG5 [Pezoporus wallicus]|uniref:nonsense-mediated mRNA decay factor SMG5 n=1 Tax=Pezoporus wallicus TaxID=35540 RepID=UPI00254BBFFD|nr:nonsense-mediated mRNA decay factor SMG5 [Pezoporus wallicus]XP_061299116.1 nonsense-mediated mRNA decay factor SMG5 [Pezoporus flaviventris]
MSQGGGAGESGEPEAKVLHTKRLYRAVVEAVHRLDLILGNKAAYQEVFKPENISLRNKLRELCVKLMFLHPVDYGRKAEELLWRKVYYEVIQLIKTNKKHIHSRSTLECAYRTHLVAGIGFYQHLLLYIQSHYQLELQCCIDWTHVTDPLIGCRKPVSASEKEMEWAQMACHRCLVYLGDLARYQNELAGVDTELLAERFYYQALSVAPQIGMPFNQLGTLAGSKYYNVEATYCYLRCIQSEVSFEGAYGNLKRLYDKAAKMYQQLRKAESRRLSPSKKRGKDIKRLLVSFMYLQSLLQPKSSSLDSELTSLCQSVLEDFNLCLFYLPSPPHLSSSSEEEEEYESGYSFLPDLLIFRMVIICLMSVHSLKRAGSKQYSAAIAFTLALFSHLLNHVNIRLQAELEEGENPVAALQSDSPDDQEPREASLEQEAEGALGNREPQEEQRKSDRQKSKKYSRLSCLRRRRHPRQLDESDLSEGFESGSSQGSGKGSDGSESASDKSDDEGEAAFDAESDSEMNSQESRSDLEEMEEDEEEEEEDEEEEEEEGSNRGKSGPKEAFKNGVEGAGLGDSKGSNGSKAEAPEPSLNGPASLATSESSIASNLQAMSTQLFQTKRCFRLAPTFSNILLKPSPDPPLRKDGMESKACVNGELEKPGLGEQDEGSDSEESLSSSKSCRNERSLQEKLQIMSNEGLLLTVKVFLDWLRTNTDLILMCAQSSQSLWNRLSVLLNLLPSAADLQDSGLALCNEVQAILSGAELPDLQTHLLLPEDVALRNLPPLRSAHKRFHFEQDRPIFTPVEECVVRLCCIRSSGHFISQLQGSILQFNPELGIFISIAQAEQDGILQQAQAQFHMAAEEARRNRLMRDMAQLRLQLEVSQLEGSLQQPKAHSAMSPYLVPDTQALCQHLALIKHLATSGRFIIIIPRTVIDGLDFLKKENAGARDSIRYLEAEFKKGNRYIRCQKDAGKSLERHKLKRQDLDAWNLYKILDSCKQLTVSQGNGEDDGTGMVTIITGFQLEDPSVFSAPMQAAIQAAAGASVELRNVLDFYKQWKELG